MSEDPNPPRPPEKDPVLIELTAKRYKAMMAGGFAAAAFCAVLAVLMMNAFWGVLAAIGLLVGIAGRLMAWWEHG